MSSSLSVFLSVTRAVRGPHSPAHCPVPVSGLVPGAYGALRASLSLSTSLSEIAIMLFPFPCRTDVVENTQDEKQATVPVQTWTC